MKKLSKKQVEKVHQLADVLKDFEFTDIQVNLESRWFITAKRDFLTANVTRYIPRTWMYYFDGIELSICLS